MAKHQIRLAQTTIEAVTDLGQKCGIEDIDTLLSLLIRKYGHNLIALLAPFDPTCDKLLQSVTETVKTEPILEPNQEVLTRTEQTPPNGEYPVIAWD
jgi:hypothetical protein